MQTKTKYRILSLALTLCLVLGILPMTAFADGETSLGDSDNTATSTDYDLKIAGIFVDDSNKDNITGPGVSGKVSYDPVTKTLTLENAELSSPKYVFDTPVESTGDLTVKLIGNNMMGASNSYVSNGVFAEDRDVTITGDGNLTIYNTISGIHAKNITVDMSGIMTVHEIGDYAAACCLKADGGKVEIKRGTLQLTSDLSNAIYGDSIVISGGTITAYAKGELYAFNNAPIFASDYKYKVVAGRTPGSAQTVLTPTDTTYTASKYVKIMPFSSNDSGSDSSGNSSSGSSDSSDSGTYNSGSYSSDGGAAISSGSVSGTVAKTNWLTNSGLSAAITAARNSAETFVRSRSSGITGTRAAVLKLLTGLEYRHDTLIGNVVDVRLNIKKPELVTKDLLVSAHTTGNIVNRRKALFEKWFANKIAVIHFDQSGEWGQAVNVAARIDLSGMDTNNLVFYAYDSASNSYRRITSPAYWIDKNGYLRFTTEYAGDIIISEGVLTRR